MTSRRKAPRSRQPKSPEADEETLTRSKPKHTLADLLAGCRPSDLRPSRKDKAWLRGGPVGKEMI
jgi:hypothetical protein